MSTFTTTHYPFAVIMSYLTGGKPSEVKCADHRENTERHKCNFDYVFELDDDDGTDYEALLKQYHSDDSLEISNAKALFTSIADIAFCQRKCRSGGGSWKL
jgi:hypothetical protein